MASSWEEVEDGVFMWSPLQPPRNVFDQMIEMVRNNEREVQENESYESAASEQQNEKEQYCDPADPPAKISDEVSASKPASPVPSFSSDPETLESSEQSANLTPNSSKISTPTSSPEDVFYDELQTFANLAVAEPVCQSAATSAVTDVISDNDSDRTDFLETPCPIRKRPTKHSMARNSSYVLTPDAHGRHTPKRIFKAVNRKLNFGKTTVRRGLFNTTTRSPLKMVNPINGIDRASNHQWTSQQREFLCILNRWYVRAPGDFADIFNAVFGLSLKRDKVRGQFESHIRFYGPRASFEYAKVLSVPFKSDRDYAHIRHTIEKTAQDLGIHLHKLEQEAEFRDRPKKFSPRTRKLYKQLVRRAKADARAAQLLPTHQISLPVASKTYPELGGAALFSVTEFSETIEDVEETRYRPSLAFRVWDDRSATKYKDGFMANIFLQKKSIPDPMPRTDAFFDSLAISHLSKQGRGGSAFVSVLSAMVQLLVYASQIKRAQPSESDVTGDPQIAIINLSAPCLSGLNKQHYAKDVIKDLRARGEMTWTRYQGECETLVWGSIPSTAILATLNLSDIEELCLTSSRVRRLLNLHYFEDATSTRSVCERLRKQKITLNRKTASAMGILARTLGLTNTAVKEQHIADFVTTMFNGWYIQVENFSDEVFMASMASSFTNSLSSLHLAAERVSQSFITGVCRGVEDVARYMPRRCRVARE